MYIHINTVVFSEELMRGLFMYLYKLVSILLCGRKGFSW